MSYPDEFDAIHKSLVNDAKQHPEYATNASALYGYSEGAEHALETVRLKGYRKPRIIATAEELDALPGESVVRDLSGMVYELDYIVSQPSKKWWITTGHGARIQHSGIDLPATALYVPEES